MLEISKKEQGRILNYVLYGELDMASIGTLEEKIKNQNLSGVKTIYFSLSNLDFIDSTGIGKLIKYYRQYSKQSINVEIINENPEIEEILRLIGVRDIIAGI